MRTNQPYLSSRNLPPIQQIISQDRDENEEDTPSPRTELLSDSSSRHARISHASHALESRRRKKNRHRKDSSPTQSHSHSQSSSYQRELVRVLIDSEREASKLRKSLSAAVQRLESEARRAADLDRENREAAERFRLLNDSRLSAQQEASKVSQELRLFQFQLDNAQREIGRAQETVRAYERQRDEAERVAARARAEARRMKRERLVADAREEGRRTGFQAGVQQAQEEIRIVAPGGRIRRAPMMATTTTVPSGSGDPDRSYATGDDAAYQRQAESRAQAQQEEAEEVREDEDEDDLSDLGIEIQEATPNDSLASPIPRYPTRNLDAQQTTPPHSPTAPPQSFTPAIQIYSLEIPPPEQLAREYNTNSNREYNAHSVSDVVLDEPRGGWVTAKKHGEINGVEVTPPSSGLPVVPQPINGQPPPPSMNKQHSPIIQQPPPSTLGQPSPINQPPTTIGQPSTVNEQQLPPMNGQPPMGQQPAPVMFYQPPPAQQKPGHKKGVSFSLFRRPSNTPSPSKAKNTWYRTFSFRKKNKPVIDPEPEEEYVDIQQQQGPQQQAQQSRRSRDMSSTESGSKMYTFQPPPPQSWYVPPKKSASSLAPSVPAAGPRSAPAAGSRSAFAGAGPSSGGPSSIRNQAPPANTATGPSNPRNQTQLPIPPPKTRSQAFDTYSFPRSRAVSMDDAQSTTSTRMSQFDLVAAAPGDGNSVRSGKYGGGGRMRERERERERERTESLLSVIKEDPMSRGNTPVADRFLGRHGRASSDAQVNMPGGFGSQSSSSKRRGPPPEIYVPPHPGAGDDPFLTRWTNLSQATFGPIPPGGGKPSSSGRPAPLDNGRRTPSNGIHQPSNGTQPSSIQPSLNGRYHQPWSAHSNYPHDTEEYPGPLMTATTPGISVLPPSARPSEPHSLSTPPTGKNHLTPNYVFQPPQMPSPRKPLSSDPPLRYNGWGGSTESFYTNRTHPRTPVNPPTANSPRAVSSPRPSERGINSPRGLNSPRGGGRRSAQSVARPMSVVNPSSPSPPPLPFPYKSSNASPVTRMSPPPLPVPYQSPLPVPNMSPIPIPYKSPSTKSVNPPRPSSAQSGNSNSRVRSASAHIPMMPPPGSPHRPPSIRSATSNNDRLISASPNNSQHALRNLPGANGSQNQIRRVPSNGSMRSMNSYNHFEPQTYLDPAYFQSAAGPPLDAEEMLRRRRQERDARIAAGELGSRAGSAAGSVHSRAGSTGSRY